MLIYLSKYVIIGHERRRDGDRNDTNLCDRNIESGRKNRFSVRDNGGNEREESSSASGYQFTQKHSTSRNKRKVDNQRRNGKYR